MFVDEMITAPWPDPRTCATPLLIVNVNCPVWLNALGMMGLRMEQLAKKNSGRGPAICYRTCDIQKFPKASKPLHRSCEVTWPNCRLPVGFRL